MELKRIARTAVAAVLLLCACCKPPGTAATDGGGRVSSGLAAARAGVKVPLPEGWRADISSDQSFRAGPAGRTILRVDLRPGAAATFPTPDALERSFAAGLPNTRIDRDRFIDSKDFVGVRLSLSVAADGGGSVRGHEVFVGTRKIGADLFLCSTAPGASAVELDQAENSCGELSWADGR